MRRTLGTLFAFGFGFALFFPFFGIARCNGDCTTTTSTVWGLELSEPVGVSLGLLAGAALAALTYRLLTVD